MHTLGFLARLVDGELHGDAEQTIRGAASIDEAGPEHITFASDDRTLEKARHGQAGAVIVAKDAPDIGRPVIRVDNPRLAFAIVLEHLAPPFDTPTDIDATARIADDATLGEGTVVGAHAVIGPGARIGNDVIIYPGVYIGSDVTIGDNTVLHPNVVVLDRVTIGSRVVLNPGVVVGYDGFGYVRDGRRHRKVPQIGTVVIEDDVEIGANSVVGRATVGTTRVGRGTKLDSLVYVAHNAQVGENVIIAGMSALAGSTILEDDVTLAGQTGVTGHLRIGRGTVVAARGLVAGDIPPGSFVSGFPARPHAENMRILAAQRRVPELLKTVAQLEKRLAALEAQLAADEADDA